MFLRPVAMFRRRSLFLIPFFTVFLFSILPSSRPMSFDLTTSGIQTGDCNRGRNVVCLQGNATPVAGMIDLNRNEPFDLGWAYYSEPLRLWDSSTGELASFITRFSLDIRPRENMTGLGSGVAFFLSAYPYQTPPNSAARNLGLIADKGKPTALVAVEFDTYWSSPFHDPVNPHIGIDIKSLMSVNTTELRSANNVAITGDATVSYDSGAQNLGVVFIDADNGNKAISLSYGVDLTKILPEWVVLGFSGATGNPRYIELNRIKSWEFNSTVTKGGTDAPQPQSGFNSTAPQGGTGAPQPQSGKQSSSSTGLIIGIVAGVGILAAGACLLLFVLRKRRRRRSARREDGVLPRTNPATNDSPRRRSIDKQIEHDNGPRRFPYAELDAATAGFGEDKKLGVGGFGSVYRGSLRDLNFDVAIKRFSKESKQGAKEYISEVKIISQLRHKNLVRLIGWCHEREDLLLVYEFMPNGSLDYHLFGAKMPTLSWPTRYRVAVGLASALSYLHTEWEQCVVHRDIKSSNIMLDSNFNAKLGDFGLARLIDHESRTQTTIAAGTLGYIAPECVISGKVGKESDVYSFGIVLLEIASGRRAVGAEMEGERCRLVDWVWNMCKNGRALEVADPRLEGQFDKVQMEQLIIIGLWCANSDPKARPSMAQAVAALNFDVTPMPSLPEDMASPFITENWSLQMPLTNTSASHSSSVQTSRWGTSYGSTVPSNTTF